MVLNLWIIKDTDVDTSFCDGFSDLLTTELDDKICIDLDSSKLNSEDVDLDRIIEKPKLKYKIRSSITINREHYLGLNNLEICEAYRKKKRLSHDKIVLYLTTKVDNGRLSDSNISDKSHYYEGVWDIKNIKNNIYIYAGSDWGDKNNNGTDTGVYLFGEELVSILEYRYSKGKPEHFSSYKSWSLEYGRNKTESLPSYIIGSFLYSHNFRAYYEKEINKIETMFKNGSRLSIREQNFIIDVIKDANFRVNQNNFHKLKDEDFNYVLIGERSKHNFAFSFTGDTVKVYFPAREAAIYAYLLLRVSEPPVKFGGLNEIELDFLDRIYTYYDRAYSIDNKSVYNREFEKYLPKIRSNIKKTLKASFVAYVWESITLEIDYRFALEKGIIGDKINVPKTKIRISQAHPLYSMIREDIKKLVNQY